MGSAPASSESRERWPIVAVLVGALGVSLVGALADWWSATDYIRTAGGAAQIAGVVLVAWDLFATWVAFETPNRTPREAAIEMLRARGRRLIPRRFRKHRVVAGGSISFGGSATLSARGRVIPPDFGEALDALRTEIDDLRREMLSEVERRDQAAAARIDSLDETTRQSIRNVALGAIRLRWWSAVLIVVGIALATWPEWIDAYLWRGPF